MDTVCSSPPTFSSSTFSLSVIIQRRRMRRTTNTAMLAIALASVLVVSPVQSLSAATATRNSQVVLQQQRQQQQLRVTDEMIAHSTPSLHNYFSYFDDEDEDDDYYDDLSEIEASVSSFQNLRRSTGSEILQSELQHQIDQGPFQFLSQHGSSDLEKVAMSSITEQLPQAAVQALIQQKQQQAPKKKNNDLNFAGTRVTVEQELQLARIIQTGAALHKIKQDLETRVNRPISRLEWAEATQLSTKELRQTVSAYREAKHDLVTANLGLVHAVVNQQCNAAKAAGISKEELVQEGSLGLLRAAELFDPSRGLRFSTYAVVWIKGILSNSHVPELVKVPAREKTKWNKIVKAQKELSATTGNTAATVEELASMTGLTVPEVVETQRRMNQAGNVLSLDYTHKMQSRSGTESGTSAESSLASDKNFQSHEADLAGRTQLQADVIAVMARNLDAREGRLLRLRYGLSDGRSRSLQECADAMGLSYSRVHQLSIRCLKKLREAAEAESLEEYLLTIA